VFYSPPHLADPLPLVKNRLRGSSFSPPHLSFAEVGMLLDSHFLVMQFLKYLQLDDLNVTSILIPISGVAKRGLGVKTPIVSSEIFLMYIVKNKY